jgi:multidrug resistance efflux pump
MSSAPSRFVAVFFGMLLFSTLLSARIHYAKVEPYDTVVLKSAVSAQVLFVDLDAEGSVVEDGEVIHLDDRIDQVDLASSRESLKLLQSMLKINEKSAASLADSLVRQKAYFERMNSLSTTSKTQKDNAFNAYAAANSQYLGSEEKIESIKKQILDMEYKIAKLEDTISKKSIRLKGDYLYRLSVRAGDFVSPGSPLATIEDHSRAKLTLYLEASEINAIATKKVIIDGQETSYRVDKVWRSADDTFISSYRAEIYIKAPKSTFSRLVKVELQ